MVYEKNFQIQQTLEQPLAFLIQGSYTCGIESDGSEFFTNGKCKIRIPPNCVEWIDKPEVNPNAHDLSPDEYAELKNLEKQLLTMLD